MEQKLGRIPVMILAALSAAAAYGLRLRQLQTIYDADGYIRKGAGWCFFTYFTILMVILYGVYALLLRRRKKDTAISLWSTGILIGGCAAALGLLLGSAAMLLSPEGETDRLLAAGGLVTAACWVVTAMLRYRGRKVSVWLFLVPVLFFMLRLIVNFRFWSRDPAILDYCYDLFAHISLMCALLHLGGFSFDMGRRRTTVFFCLCGIFFGAASLAGAQTREVCISGGAMVWLLIHLWLLLRPGKKRAAEEAREASA